MDKRLKLESFAKFHREQMKNPEFKREFERLQPEFAVIQKMIDARVKKGLTQKQLAKKLKTKQSVISRIETGRGNPTLAFLQRLADVFNARLEIKFIG